MKLTKILGTVRKYANVIFEVVMPLYVLQYIYFSTTGTEQYIGLVLIIAYIILMVIPDLDPLKSMQENMNSMLEDAFK